MAARVRLRAPLGLAVLLARHSSAGVSVVRVGVAAAGQLERTESQPGEQKRAADDQVLGLLDRRAKLQSSRDDQSAQQ